MEEHQTGRRSSVIPAPSILSRRKLSSSTEGISHGEQKYHGQRRNSISSLLGPFTRSRAAGPPPSRPSSSSLHSQGSKYRSLKLYQYLAGHSSSSSSSNGGNGSSAVQDTELSTLDEAFQKVHSQLQEMTEQSRSVRTRLDSLSSAISQLSDNVSPVTPSPTAADETVKYPTLHLPTSHKKCNGHLALGRVHSQPPMAPLKNGWDLTDIDDVESDELALLTPETSQESRVDASEEEELLEEHYNRSKCVIVAEEDEEECESNESSDSEVFHSNTNCTDV